MRHVKVINLKPIGRFGNQMFQYAFARAFAEQYGFELHISPWIGEKIFQLPEHLRIKNEYPILDDVGAIEASQSFELVSYCQNQNAMIYSRETVRDWFKIKPSLESILFDGVPNYWPNVAHRRVGDYLKLGYPVVSKESYECASEIVGCGSLHYLTEENPTRISGLDPDFADFLPDFHQMLHCDVLFRGNSSFSWWAATLGDSDVYSPIIESAIGGQENRCCFVKGNWPRLAVLPCVTNLHLKSE